MPIRAKEEISRRAMGVPRIAISIADTIRKVPDNDYERVFRLMKIDKLGLQQNHRSILRYLAEVDRAVGVQSIAYGCEIEQSDVIHIYERDLLKLGMVIRTPRGREITSKGKQYIGESDARDHRKQED
jgi:Holliday junction DNA helicase RuvB